MTEQCSRRCMTQAADGSRRSLLSRRIKTAALIAALLSAVAMMGQSQGETRIKAAYVFNLTKYVEWPVSGNQVVIGVTGAGPQVEALRELNGKTSDSRQVVVLVEPSDADLKRCDLLYVTSPSDRKIEAILQKVAGTSTLTVGEAASFTRAGGMIALLTVGDRIQIEVNLAACQKAKLKVSSRLLSLARIVGSERAEARP